MLKDYEKLKAEANASQEYLDTQKYYFERKLLNGLGEEINYTLNHPEIYNNRKECNLITKLKKLFKRK